VLVGPGEADVGDAALDGDRDAFGIQGEA